MNTRIGKYILTEDETKLRISYRFTFSDLIGSVYYVLMVLVGGLLLLTFYKTYTNERIYQFTDWIMGLIGLGLGLGGVYLLAAALYTPTGGIISIDKQKREITIRELFSSETLSIHQITSVYFTLKTSRKPKMKYAMLSLQLRNGKQKDCLVIRSAIPVDLGRKIDHELLVVSRQLRDRISAALKGLKPPKQTT